MFAFLPIQHILQWALKPAPTVAHCLGFVFGVTPQGKGGHKGLQRLFSVNAIVNIGKHLIHAGKL
jgi:hypothetical protein